MNNTLSTTSMIEPSSPKSENLKSTHAPSSRSAFVFLLVLVAGVTTIGGISKGNLGLWSSLIGGGLAISNYLAFMWLWKGLSSAGKDEATRYMALLLIKLMSAGAIIIMVMLVLKPHAVFFLASYSVLLPAMFLAVIRRG